LIGYWLDPDGADVEVHDSPPHTHAGHALAMGANPEDPVGSLLRRGWVTRCRSAG